MENDDHLTYDQIEFRRRWERLLKVQHTEPAPPPTENHQAAIDAMIDRIRAMQRAAGIERPRPDLRVIQGGRAE